MLSQDIFEPENFGDFSLYISQAKSILDGTTPELLEQNTFSMQNSQRILGPDLYPVGTSLILVPVYAIFGLDFTIMKVVMILFYLSSLYVIYKLFNKI